MAPKTATAMATGANQALRQNAGRESVIGT
jgi:hypothetical protein